MHVETTTGHHTTHHAPVTHATLTRRDKTGQDATDETTPAQHNTGQCNTMLSHLLCCRVESGVRCDHTTHTNNRIAIPPMKRHDMILHHTAPYSTDEMITASYRTLHYNVCGVVILSVHSDAVWLSCLCIAMRWCAVSSHLVLSVRRDIMWSSSRLHCASSHTTT